ncbi:glycoside hydrolase family 9 protein [Vibrio sp.]|nr:glycoside hydrolase family 9 protein [Vibrio sp.]
MPILTNHIGYACSDHKFVAVSCISSDKSTLSYQKSLNDKNHLLHLHNAKTHELITQFTIHEAQVTDHWQTPAYSNIDFSEFRQSGEFYFQYGQERSYPFMIKDDLLFEITFSDLLHYFHSQRCSSIWNKQDESVPVFNSEERFNVKGGWYDASGDVSKYLTHLSVGHYMNPQQIPMVIWNMLQALSHRHDTLTNKTFLKQRLIDEITFGADFLVRMQHPDGYFFTNVFDNWSKDPKRRELCIFEGQDGLRYDAYQASFREGAGVSIAALARASTLDQSGEFQQKEYLDAAIKGYQHLETHQHEYTSNGENNIIDDYCALLAAIELHLATKETHYLSQAQYWAHRLQSKQMSDDNISHFWSANDDGSRPYYHAAEAGLPVIALCRYLDIEKDKVLRDKAIQTIENSCLFEHRITNEVANPLGYPRQYTKALYSDKKSQFFMPHNNETGYWWQGENARLGSLAAMAQIAQPYLTVSLQKEMQIYSKHCLNWILGLNPFNQCMLDGHGFNNPNYLPDLGFYNAKGGVCNGITSGFNDESDIAFDPAPYCDDMLQNWRWGEQWIPHAAWLLLAVTYTN